MPVDNPEIHLCLHRCKPPASFASKDALKLALSELSPICVCLVTLLPFMDAHKISDCPWVLLFRKFNFLTP